MKAPGFGDNRKNTMKDMAIATGGTVFNDDADLNSLDDVTLECLGSAQEIVVTKDDTLIMKVGDLVCVCRDIRLVGCVIEDIERSLAYHTTFIHCH